MYVSTLDKFSIDDLYRVLLTSAVRVFCPNI